LLKIKKAHKSNLHALLHQITSAVSITAFTKVLFVFGSDLGGSKPCNWNPERRAGYVIHTDSVAECDAAGFSTVLTADTNL